MHSNVYRMLKPGGVAFHLFPTLYAVPFFINWLIPEQVSRGMVFLLNPVRRDSKRKFPAHYSWCAGSNEQIKSNIASVGYTDVKVERFYGHELSVQGAVAVLGRAGLGRRDQEDGNVEPRFLCLCLRASLRRAGRATGQGAPPWRPPVRPRRRSAVGRWRGRGGGRRAAQARYLRGLAQVASDRGGASAQRQRPRAAAAAAATRGSRRGRSRSRPRRSSPRRAAGTPRRRAARRPPSPRGRPARTSGASAGP